MRPPQPIASVTPASAIASPSAACSSSASGAELLHLAEDGDAPARRRRSRASVASAARMLAGFAL